MQFKHPEILYALFLLVIPIIVHLFQLRRFQKELFTNVAFLKEVTLQTRKSSQLKKWLVLLTRLSLLAAIIIAFAQPFTVSTNNYSSNNETVIYLDNSFSMQAEGPHGELLKRAINDLISVVPEDKNISLITNNRTFKNTTIKAIKNELLQLGYSSSQLTYDAALLKSRNLFSNRTDSFKNLVFISDFQEKGEAFTIGNDSTTHYNLIKLLPVNNNNIYLDSVYISKTSASNFELKTILKNTGQAVDNLPVSLFDGSNLLAKASVAIDKETTTAFSIPANKAINGTITINDINLQFDNQLFFSINKTEKINVLAITPSEDNFLRRIYTDDEFNYTVTKPDQLDYNTIDRQNLIVLNELNSIPASLISVLRSFTNNGGHLLIIPSETINRQSYNNLLMNYGLAGFGDIANNEKRITTINYSHPLYSNGVFEKQVSNFQYPKVNSYYNLAIGNAWPVLQFEDGKPFLFQSSNAYIFSSPLNENNSNFKNSPLIVPTLYNIGRSSLNMPELYYTIGNDNSFDVAIELPQDHVLSLVNGSTEFIPQQQYYNNKIIISTSDLPDIANTYAVNNDKDVIEYISYNYNREESKLFYQNLSSTNKNVTINNSITNTFESLKSNSKVNELWKWFVIFALLSLIVEMLILKYLK